MHNILHIFADTTPARTHFSLTRTTAHALARAFLLFAVMVIITPAVWADDGRNRHKVESIDSEFGKNKVFTVTSGSGNRMYVNGTSLLRDNSTNVSGAYQFAFVEDPKSTSEYYLYNVGTEQFVSYKSTTTEPLITNSSDAQHIYVYTPGNSGFPNSKYVLSFNSNIATSTWGTSQTGDGTNESNTTNHIFHLETTSVRINDWVTIGGAGHNSLTITEVPDVTFTDAEIAQAQSILNGTFVYSPSTFAAQRVKITTNSKVYTLLAEDGKYLSATSSGLATSTTNTSTNEQWVFIEDETDNTKVYLYNVGQKKFVLVSGSSLSIGGGSSIGTVKVYTTEDAHNYNVAFGFGSDWTTGPALSTNGVYTSAPSQSNRFQVAEVDGATFTESDMNAAKKRLLTDLTDFSVKTVAAVGLTANTQKYIIYTNPNSGETNYRGGFYADNNGLTSTYKHDSSNPYANASDTHQQFAFVSKSDDDQSVTYLYSVDQERFVEGKTGNSPLNLTNGGSVNPIYVYLTNNFDYNLAFAFDTNANWNVNGSGSGSTNVGINTGNGVFISNYNQLEDLGSRFTADKAGSFTDDELTAARTFLSGTYPAAAITNLTDANNVALSTNTKVYTLQDENGNYLSAGTSGLTTSSTGTSANEQFVFYEDGSGNIYLYSVGKESFITASKGYGTATQFYVFNTTDAHGYTLGLAANATWSTAPIGTGSTTVPDRSNRFQATDVTSSATTYSQDFANVVFSGSYTKSYFKTQSLTTVSGGTASGKVYTLQAENGRYLIANSNGLTTSATEPTNANGQFIFFQNPNATGGTEEVYLYSVGQQKFVKSDGTLVGMTASGTASQLCVFTTGDYHGYNLAFAFGNTAWASATYAVGSGTNVAPLQSNRFKLTEVAASSLSTTMENTTAYAKVVYTGQRRVSLDEVGLSFDCVYNIYTSQSDGALSANSSSTLQGVSLNAKDSHQQFVFHKDENEENKVYLFNVYEERFANKTKGFATGKTDPIYVFLTGNDSYPYVLAFSENPTWGKSLSSTSNGYYVINSGSNVSINDWTNLSAASNHFQISKVDDITYSADFVQKILNDSYGDPVDFSTLGLTTNSVVYNLKSENGAYLSASGSSVASTTATTTSSDANAQFVFYQAPADKSKTYLYSVGRGAFVASDGTYSSTPAALTFYQTSDPDSYSFAIGLNSTWAASVVGNSSAEVIKSTRFQVEEVETPSEQWVENEPATLLSGKYSPITLAEAGIDVNKVYYVVSDVNSNNNHVLMDGHLSSLNGYSRTDESALTTIVNDNSSIMKFAFVTDKDDASKIYLLNVSTSKAVGKTGDMSNEANSPTYQPIYLFATNNYKYPLAFSFSPTWGETDAVYLDANKTDFTHGDTFVSTDATIGSAKRFRIVPMYDDTYSLTLGRAALKGWMTTAFHYKGASGRDFMANGMQNVSEVHYYYYVDTKRHEISSSTTKQVLLKLPVEGYASYTAASDVYADGSGHVLEPRAYYRWYDYKTDFMPADDRIGKQGSELSIKYDTLGRSLGYFATAISSDNAKPHFGNVGVYYNVPDNADDVNWEGDIIACDVSRYIDYNDATINSITDAWNSRGTFTHEPTLSIRYVYHILPAQKIADQIQQKLLNTVGGHSDTEWNKGILTFGAKDEKASMNLRGDLQEFHRYFFHPLTNATKHVYYGSGAAKHKITASDFSTDLVNAKGIEWRVYNSDQTAYRVITTKTGNDLNAHIALQTGGSVYNSSTVALNGTDWKDLDGNAITENMPTIDINSSCYIVGYLVNGENKCPFYNARLLITDNYPMSVAQLESGYHIERTENYMSSHFDAVAEFSFDNENNQQNLNSTTSTLSTTNSDISQEPSPFSWRQYGFVYNKLANYTALNYGWDGLSTGTRTASTTPIHGEYSLYKSYLGVNRDRTYEKTNGQQTGYFLYTDASDEARIIGTQDFIGSLCTGSKLYITGWVANQAPRGTEMPEVKFDLLGVTKDADDNDISTTPIASIYSGKFENNVEGFNAIVGDERSAKTNTWYQVYGVFTIPAEANIEQYTDFRIAMYNLCTQATGADYAVDDIQVFVDNAKVTVIQDHAPCGDGASTIPLKITANYETMKSVAKVTNADKTVYYRFHKKDGTVLTGNYDGSNTDGKYGTATIPAVYNSSDKLNSGTSTEISRYFTGVDGETDIVLAYKAFSGINVNDIFYVTLNTAGTPDDEGSWGKPTDVCSAYSSDFQIIEQNIEATGRNSVTVAVECGHEFSTTYQNFSVGITVPDQIAGGSISLNNKIPFFWFKGTVEQYAQDRTVTVDGTTSTVTLQNAVTGYTAAYPGEAFSYAKELKEGVYTAAERELLRQYAYVPPTTKTYSATTESTVSNNTATIHYTDGSEEKSPDFTAGTETSGLPAGVSSVHTVISHVGDVITVTVDTTYTDGRANSAKYVATKKTETTNTTDGDGNTITTTTNTYSVSITDGGKAGLLYANASYSLYNYPVSTGTTTFLAISTVETITINHVVYRICTNPMAISVRGAQNGPGLTFGIEGVVYPSTLSYQYRTIRMGLPQMRAMGKDGKEQPGAGLLRVPISGKTWQTLAANDERLRFVKLDNGNYVDSKEIYLSETNDPTLSEQVSSKLIRFCDVKITKATQNYTYTDDNNEEQTVTETGMYVLSADSLWLNFYNFNTDSIHEGYEYEVQLLFVRTNVPAADANANNCSGETFLKFKIVPEYVTWNTSSSNNFNANWNNDRNWRRSTAAEIYKLDYKDYRTATGATATGTYTAPLFSANVGGNKTVASSTYTKTNPVDNTEGFADHDVPQSYTPMYFTKVTIPKMGAGVPYPMMPFIQYYQSNGMVASMSNLKGNRATSEIEYDMMANYDNAYTTQNASTLSRKVGTGSVQDSAFVCTVFNGNICQEIYFKPGAELRQQQFLRYQRAWVDVTFPINQWSTFATPMAQTPAGDFYVPKFSAQQTTTAFKEIHFSDKDSKMDQNGNVVANGSYGYFGKGGVNIYSRLRLPSYQRLWGQDAYEYKDENTKYTAYDDPTAMLIYNSDDTSTESNDLEDKEYNNNRNNWSHPYNTMVSASSDEPQEYGTHLNGHGLALRFGDDYATPATVTKDGTTTDSEWKGDSVLLRLPKSDTEFEFMKPGWNATTGKTEEQPSGFTQTITTESTRPNDPWYRLGVAYNMPTYDYAAPKTITTKELSPSYLLYDLVGNPYISSISVDQFIATNESRLSKVVRNAGEDNEESYYAVWVLENDKLKEYKQGENNIIKPAQAFFVRLKEQGVTLRFTTLMEVDPTVSTGGSTAASKRYEPYRTFTVKDITDVEDVIHNDDVAVQFATPQTGVVDVTAGTKPLTRIVVYDTNGSMLRSVKAEATGTTRISGLTVGIVIVRAIATDGTAQTAKIVVR